MTVQTDALALFDTFRAIEPSLMVETLAPTHGKDSVIEACQVLMERGVLFLDPLGFLVRAEPARS